LPGFPTRNQKPNYGYGFSPVFGYGGKLVHILHTSKFSSKRDYFRWRLPQITSPERKSLKFLYRENDDPWAVRIDDSLSIQQGSVSSNFRGFGLSFNDAQGAQANQNCPKSSDDHGPTGPRFWRECFLPNFLRLLFGAVFFYIGCWLAWRSGDGQHGGFWWTLIAYLLMFLGGSLGLWNWINRGTHQKSNYDNQGRYNAPCFHSVHSTTNRFGKQEIWWRPWPKSVSFLGWSCYSLQELLDHPNVVRDSSFHRGRNPRRLMHPAEIVPGKIESQSRFR